MAKGPRVHVQVLAGLWGASLVGASSTHACRVMLVPGAFVTGSAAATYFLRPEDYFKEYREFFRARGCQVRMVEFPPDGTIEQRGLVLKDQLLRFYREAVPIEPGKSPESGRILLVAHSQGGLDARFALQTLFQRNSAETSPVSAVASIGVPHLGTPVADWAVGHRDRGSLLYWALRLFGGYDLRNIPFAGEMTPAFLEAKAKYFAKVPGVRYGSARAVCRTDCHGYLRLLARWAGDAEGDGLVAGEGQRFGDDLGEFDLDHVTEVNVDPGKAAERKRLLERIWEWSKGALASAEGSPR